MITRVKFLLIRMEKQGRKSVRIISVLKKTFGKDVKTLPKFADNSCEFIRLFSW